MERAHDIRNEEQSRPRRFSFSGFNRASSFAFGTPSTPIVLSKSSKAERKCSISVNSKNFQKPLIQSFTLDADDDENEPIDWIDYLRTLDKPPDRAQLHWIDFLRTNGPDDKNDEGDDMIEWRDLLREKPNTSSDQRSKKRSSSTSLSGLSGPKVAITRSDSRRNARRTKMNWVEFLRSEPPKNIKQNRRQMMNWLEFVRTEPPKSLQEKQKFLSWIDSVKKESPEDYSDMMNLVDFLRTEPPSTRESLIQNAKKIDSPREANCFPWPKELTLFIMSFLDVVAIGRLSRTTKFLRTLSGSNLLWKSCYLRTFPESVATENTREKEESDPSYWKNLCRKDLPYEGNWQAWSVGRSRSGTVGMISNLFIRKTDMRLLFFGLEGSGKTTIMRTLLRISKQNYSINTGRSSLESETTQEIPTKGCSNEVVQFRDISYHILDVGGCHSKNSYAKYERAFDFIDANVLVVDASDIYCIPRVKKLVDFLVKRPELLQKPLLVWANKKDVSHNMYTIVDIICDFLNRYKNPFQDWYIRSSCGINGDGLADGLDWLREVAKDPTVHGSPL
eukprot:TRINITY_DN8392_c0_g1_i1.p1 TRINITY_DN8392_c0_g1~~TRINITY_DN8392_c0_g1_i1.p1  ORF type:complete len:561 (+),score=123.76 TRINITY_DN8392_c0_g1_i1:111-1793(+)